ncbi:OmpA family protein [Paraburkholderia sp. BL21I4N1]|uniref:OmpA family protein n=1 Tax=Paraburkholderia sp. BL21I4N1 TaxID=1938801 RepID=UPI000CFCC548|nr:OmpA family protein [Paraburkholderia sp. BL21I4N1]PQV50653.1 outer membrane protein OmpA-like peptidoglycan-associated protein [Paraburkholderia sp. BL21I4N1]
MTRKLGLMLLAAGTLAGCSAASGPTFSAYTIALPNNEKAFQVNCNGLFDSSNTCYSKAREICGNRPVHPFREISPLAAAGSQRDVHTLMFQCVPTPVTQAAPVVAPAAPVAQPAAPTASPTPPAPQKVSLNGDASFDLDKATLTSDARNRLDALINAAVGATLNTVAVNGYTDSTGSAAYNQALSTRRALSVAQYLRDHGLRARQFLVTGYGQANPVASNETPSGRAKNRRVEIVPDSQ